MFSYLSLRGLGIYIGAQGRCTGAHTHVEAKRERIGSLEIELLMALGCCEPSPGSEGQPVLLTAEHLSSLLLSFHGDAFLLWLLHMQPHRHSHVLPFLKVRAASPRISGC